MPISAATTYRVGKIMKRAVRRSLESMSTIYKILQESFQGIKIVKAFAMERVERRRFFSETKNLYRKSVRVAMIDAMSDPVLEMLTLATVAIALLAGSYLVLNRTIYLDLGLFRLQLAAQPMAIQDLLTLYAWLAGVSDPIRKLANVHSKIQRASAAADRICAMMDRGPEGRRPQARAEPAAASPGGRARPGRLRLQRRHARAQRREPHSPAWRDDRAGRPQRLRQDDPDEPAAAVLGRRFGAIRIDGRDIREVPLRSLRRQIGIVLQETILFQDTIANNIAYGDPHASRDAIVRGRRAGLCPSVHHGLAAGIRHDGRRARATGSRAASGSGSPWPARCSATRPS